MSYEKVKGAKEKVSAPFTQTFTKHAPRVPAKQKLKFSAVPKGKTPGIVGTRAMQDAIAEAQS